MHANPDKLADELLAGDRRALARAITLLESSRPEDREPGHRLLERVTPKAGHAMRVGISGVPGVGKSTFIETFGNHVIEQGHRVAVLAVDPSSGISGGSIEEALHAMEHTKVYALYRTHEGELAVKRRQ